VEEGEVGKMVGRKLGGEVDREEGGFGDEQ